MKIRFWCFYNGILEVKTTLRKEQFMTKKYVRVAIKMATMFFHDVHILSKLQIQTKNTFTNKS